MPDSLPLFQMLGISLGLGLLVGLQRERSATKLAGLRTFPIITLLGSASGLLAQEYGGWILAAGLVSVAILALVGNLLKIAAGHADGGLTTEFAILLMYAVGAYLVFGQWDVGVAVGAGTAVLLQFKPELHGIAARLGNEDLRAIMQFALISFVILPVLPNETYGPFDILNPFQIWLLVVLIVGISLTGYVIYKFFGQNAGIVLGGILGGLVSSTATTASFARQARRTPTMVRAAALVVAIASCVVYARVLIEISAISTKFLLASAPVILILLLLTAAPALAAWWHLDLGDASSHEQRNPTELRTAVTFAVLFAVILWGMAATKHYLGGGGLYVVAAVSGLTDMDAVTLSTARLVADERIDVVEGWRLVVLAIVSNLVFKGILAGFLGGRAMAWRVAGLFATPVLGGLALVALGPAVAIDLGEWLPTTQSEG